LIYEYLHGFVVLKLFSDRQQVLFSDELGAAFSFPGETDLVVRAMLLRWHGLASASGRAAYVANGLKPHLVRTFKLSNDPNFLEKLEDVIGLYMNPPENALVFCVDEKILIRNHYHRSTAGKFDIELSL
jgi:hypothetical protein